jgi:hypothetical protein
MATHKEALARKQEVANIAVADLPTKIWNYTVAPDAQSAADFLNVPPAQSAGEGMISNRADGSVDVYYFL